MDRESASKKKFKGFLMFFTLQNFETALVGDMKLWLSRRRRRRYRRYRLLSKRKSDDAKGKMLVMANKR
jgi:hypothetical protein